MRESRHERMRRVGHDQCMHPAADDHVVIQLSRDEALVLYELLHRWEEHGQVAEPEHHAERVALWNLSATLERELAQPSILPAVASSQTRECDWRIDQSRRQERTE